MKLLLDQGLPRTAAELLRTAGVDALHVGEIGMPQPEMQPSCRLLRMSSALSSPLMPTSANFLLSLEPLLRRLFAFEIEGLRAAAIVSLLQAVLTQCQSDLAHGAVVTVQEQRLRIRRLPLLHTDA